MRRAPLWGWGFFGSVLALIGVAPFAIFMSEFQILHAAAATGSFVVMGLFLAGAGIVFVGALRLAIIPAWGAAVREPAARRQRPSLVDGLLVLGGLGLLLVLGVWLPAPLHEAMAAAARLIGDAP
jgi:hydrogenase-4 component F